jgi:NADPH-dependent glutamate synthase beta subunit-like oxidoreductase
LWAGPVTAAGPSPRAAHGPAAAPAARSRRSASSPAGDRVTGPPAADPAWPLERAPALLETSTPGVFAAGDVRSDSVKRCASAVGEGALAVTLVHAQLAAQRAQAPT